MNWLQQDVKTDVYGRTLLDAGLSKPTVQEWSVDPAVQFDGGKTSLFDLLERVVRAAH